MTFIFTGGRQTAPRFLINNVKDVDVVKLAQLAGATIIEPAEMNVRLNHKLKATMETLPDCATPMVIYPGSSSMQLTGKLSAFRGIRSQNVSAKRHWQPGQNPVYEVSPFKLPVDVTHLFVVDDVISSGGTMYLVQGNVPRNVECWSVAQVSQRIGKTQRKALRGFGVAIIGAELCGEAMSYVPINSVSTLSWPRSMQHGMCQKRIGKRSSRFSN
jgi:hypothetical protein